MKNRNGKTAAVIDIGSSMLRMRIAQWTSGGMRDVENAEYPLHIGHETFTEGRISYESIKLMSSVLTRYRQVMLEYGVERWRLVATTALRDAQNCAYVIDQILIRNGMRVEVLEDGEEKTLIYSEMLRHMSRHERFAVEDTLMGYIGSGTFGMALCRRGVIVKSLNMRVGAYKLFDMLGGEQGISLFEEYMDELRGTLEMHADGGGFDNLIVTGKEIELVCALCGVKRAKDSYSAERRTLSDFYLTLEDQAPAELARRYALSERQASTIAPAMAIYRMLAHFSRADRVIVPSLNYWDTVLYGMLRPKKGSAERQLYPHTIASVRHLAARFGCEIGHGEGVREYCMSLFDALRDYHGLTAHDRLLLEGAALLHECGNYVNIKNHNLNAYHLIKYNYIIGLDEDETGLIGCVARYHNYDVPMESDGVYRELGERDKLRVSKLCAMLRLCDSLDKSHRGKFASVSMEVTEDTVTVRGTSAADVRLERWAFEENALFFEEVFGVKAVFEFVSSIR